MANGKKTGRPGARPDRPAEVPWIRRGPRAGFGRSPPCLFARLDRRLGKAGPARQSVEGRLRGGAGRVRAEASTPTGRASSGARGGRTAAHDRWRSRPRAPTRAAPRIHYRHRWDRRAPQPFRRFARSCQNRPTPSFVRCSTQPGQRAAQKGLAFLAAMLFSSPIVALPSASSGASRACLHRRIVIDQVARTPPEESRSGIAGPTSPRSQSRPLCVCSSFGVPRDGENLRRQSAFLG